MSQSLSSAHHPSSPASPTTTPAFAASSLPDPRTSASGFGILSHTPSSIDDPARDHSPDTDPQSLAKLDPALDHHPDSPPPLTADNSSASSSINGSPDKTEPGGFLLDGQGTPEPDPDILSTDVDMAVSQAGDTQAQNTAEGEGDWSSDGFEPDLRRVKVYELVGSRWSDRGTAFCQGNFDNETQEAKLIARSETDSSEILLACTIRPADIYQRQQDTLIVWTEPDGTDFALSFQDAEGCSEVWEFITDVQRHLNSKGALFSSTLAWLARFLLPFLSGHASTSALVDSPPADDAQSSPLGMGNGNGPGTPHSVTTQQIIQSGRLPDPQMGIIGEIEKAIRALARTPTAKERICEYIQQEEYVKAMLAVFGTAESLENIETLHALCSCMQTILLLNDHSMFEHILQDDLWLGVVGMLEYDPEFPTYKANYRDFLIQNSQFVQPIVIEDATVQRKIHQTYRLQYLKDVILARALDDSTFNVLNSCIIFNQIDIINHVQNDARFLGDVVGIFVGGDAVEESKAGDEDKATEKKDATAMDVDMPKEEHPVAGPSSSTTTSTSTSSTSSTSPPTLPLTTRRKKVILLIQQLCSMGKNVQLPARIALFRTLVNRGILYAVQWAFQQSDRQMISTAGEILAVILEHDTPGVRSHVLKQSAALERVANGSGNGSSSNAAEPDHSNSNSSSKSSIPPPIISISLPTSANMLTDPNNLKGKEAIVTPPFNESLLQVMCKIMAGSGEMALQNQFADSLRTMLEVPLDPVGDQHAPAIGPRMLARPRDDPGTERFLDNFYKAGVFTLLKPLTNDVPNYVSLNDTPLDLTRERANLYLYLCDLLCSFALQHSFRSHFFILSSNVSAHVASLLSVRDKHLCLAALRFFRICLKLNNRNLFNHLIKHDVMGPVITLTQRECHRDNLLTSTCQEFFDYMRKENLKDFVNYTMAKHEAKVRHLAAISVGPKTYQLLITRWEINNEPPPKEVEKTETATSRTRLWGQGKLMETEEEDYFNNSDDDDSSSVAAYIRNTTSSLLNPPKRKRIRLNMSGMAGSQGNPRPLNGGNLPPRSQSPLSTLLDYDEDDEPEIGPQPLGVGVGAGELMKPVFPDADEDITPLPDSPILPHREIQILPAKPPEDSDPEDDLLESLVNGGQKKLQQQASLPATTNATGSTTHARRMTGVGAKPSASATLSMPPMRTREKRRRDEEEEDEQMMERLASKGKRASMTPDPQSDRDSSASDSERDQPPHLSQSQHQSQQQQQQQRPVKSMPAKNLTGEDASGPGPKKLKLKFSMGTKTMAANLKKAAAPLVNVTKDGDGG